MWLMADVQRKLVLMLAPFAPYLAHELWETLGETSDLLRAPWPQYDPALAKEEEVEIGIQVNGKIRSRIVVAADATDEQVRELALADEKVKAAIDGKEIVKVLVVKGRLVNIAVKYGEFFPVPWRTSSHVRCCWVIAVSVRFPASDCVGASPAFPPKTPWPRSTTPWPTAATASSSMSATPATVDPSSRTIQGSIAGRRDRRIRRAGASLRVLSRLPGRRAGAVW